MNFVIRIRETVCIPLLIDRVLALLLDLIRILVGDDRLDLPLIPGIDVFEDDDFLDSFLRRHRRIRIHVGCRFHHQAFLGDPAQHGIFRHAAVIRREVARRTERIDTGRVRVAATAATHCFHISAIFQIYRRTSCKLTTSEMNDMFMHPPFTLPRFGHLPEGIDQVHLVILDQFGRLLHHRINRIFKREIRIFVPMKFQILKEVIQMHRKGGREVPTGFTADHSGKIDIVLRIKKEFLILPLPIIRIQAKLVIISSGRIVVRRFIRFGQFEPPIFNRVAQFEKNRFFHTEFQQNIILLHQREFTFAALIDLCTVTYLS